MKLQLFLILLLVGCTTGTGEIVENVRRGSDAVIAKFIAPPHIAGIMQKTTYTIMLSNEGASEANGIYSFTLDEAALGALNPTSGRFKLRGRTQFSPEGDRQMLSFKVQTRELPPRKQGTEATVRLNTCYDYSTQAVANVCIDPRPEREEIKACKTKPVSLTGGQGGPVAVTRVELDLNTAEREKRIEPTAHITLRNIGSGLLLTQGVTSPCTGKPTEKEDFDIVHVSATISDLHMQCEDAKLLEKEATITCTLPEGLPERAAYLTPVTINLEYGYFQQAMETIIIRK